MHMPEETVKFLEIEPVSVLVSGNDSEVLSEEEMKGVQAYLKLFRSDTKELYVLANAITECSTANRFNLEGIISVVLRELGSHSDEIQGMLAHQLGEPPFVTFLYNKEEGNEFNEPESLAAYLTVLRAGGWLARWLDQQVLCFADKDRNPAPHAHADDDAADDGSRRIPREAGQRAPHPAEPLGLARVQGIDATGPRRVQSARAASRAERAEK